MHNALDSPLLTRPEEQDRHGPGISPGSGSRQSRDLPVEGKKLGIKRPINKKNNTRSGAPKKTKKWSYIEYTIEANSTFGELINQFLRKEESVFFICESSESGDMYM